MKKICILDINDDIPPHKIPEHLKTQMGKAVDIVNNLKNDISATFKNIDEITISLQSRSNLVYGLYKGEGVIEKIESLIKVYANNNNEVIQKRLELSQKNGVYEGANDQMNLIIQKLKEINERNKKVYDEAFKTDHI